MFKNAIVFSIKDEFEMPADFNGQLESEAIRPMQPNDAVSKGWVSPFNNNQFVYTDNNCHLFQFGLREKIIPAAAINQLVEQREALKIEREGRGYTTKERRELKDSLYLEQLPSALQKMTKVFCYIDLDAKMFVVDTSSQNKAEDIASFLRQTLGSFKIRAYGNSSYCANVLSHWVKSNQPPEHYSLTNDVILKSMDESRSTIRASNLELLCDQMSEHIDSGFYATTVGLDFNNRISFNLGQDLSLKKIKLSDIASDELSNTPAESLNDEIAAKFCLMSGEIKAAWVPLQKQMSEAA